MSQNEKESAGLTFYQSLILSLAKNPDITNKTDQSALAIAMHINDVAARIIQVIHQDEESK